MKRADPSVSLVWVYTGRNPSERLEALSGLDAAQIEIIAVGNVEVQRAAELFTFSRPDVSLRTLDSISMEAIWSAIVPGTGAVVFWMDDEKPVAPTFPLRMAEPVIGPTGEGERQVHYWEGNALAISRTLAESLMIRDMKLRDDRLLTLLSDIVDRSARMGGGRVQLTYSPLEKLTAMDQEPVGLAA